MLIKYFCRKRQINRLFSKQVIVCCTRNPNRIETSALRGSGACPALTDLYEGSEWFRVLGTNPMPYYLAFLYPWLFDGIKPEDDDQEIEQALLFLVKNMTQVEKRQLLYLMAGRHGSPWYSLLQMFTAHCHCSLRSRVTAARTILENYEMDMACGSLVCQDNVQPDMKMLHHAVEEGKLSVFNQLSGYTNVDFPTED